MILLVNYRSLRLSASLLYFKRWLILFCHVNYEMKTTVGSTSSPNVVIGDPVTGNALDRSLRLSPAKSMREWRKEENVTK